jgi:uncharacterized C2H2 Zn-finger protein
MKYCPRCRRAYNFDDDYAKHIRERSYLGLVNVTQCGRTKNKPFDKRGCGHLIGLDADCTPHDLTPAEREYIKTEVRPQVEAALQTARDAFWG